MLRIFDDIKSIKKNKVQKKTIPVQYIDQKRIVDINKLLNRVRMDKKNENKKQVIFYGLTILALGLFSTFITAIK
jgi:hypothetical protein